MRLCVQVTGALQIALLLLFLFFFTLGKNNPEGVYKLKEIQIIIITTIIIIIIIWEYNEQGCSQDLY